MREAQRVVQREAVEAVQQALVVVAQQLHVVHRRHLGRRGDQRLVHRLAPGRIGKLLQEDLLDLHAAQHLHDLLPAGLVELEEGRQVGGHQLDRLLDEFLQAAQQLVPARPRWRR